MRAQLEDRVSKDFAIQCKFCHTLLEGKEQFFGHMIHSHDLRFEMLRATWDSMQGGRMP